jgi:antitoxin ChpS
MAAIKLRKVGGSVTVAIPPHILEALALRAGSEVDVSVDQGRVVLVAAKLATQTGRIGLAARLAMCDLTLKLSPEEQAEIDAWEYMKPVGREVI